MATKTTNAAKNGGKASKGNVAATVAEVLKASTSPKNGKATKTAGKPSTNGTTSFGRNPLGDPRLPAVGSTITKEFRGKTLKVKRKADGFLFNGKLYSSLSKIGTEVSGCETNGFKFFGLLKPVEKVKEAPAPTAAKNGKPAGKKVKAK